jgi:hypothetical protein
VAGGDGAAARWVKCAQNVLIRMQKTLLDVSCKPLRVPGRNAGAIQPPCAFDLTPGQSKCLDHGIITPCIILWSRMRVLRSMSGFVHFILPSSLVFISVMFESLNCNGLRPITQEKVGRVLNV